METKIDEETAKKIQGLQLLEQNMQNVLVQKQAFLMERNETENALEELKDSKGDVYKIAGQIMIKTKKSDAETDLKRKKEILDLRVKSLEKQENFLKEQITKERDEVISKLK